METVTGDGLGLREWKGSGGGLAAKGNRLLFWGDENILKWHVVMTAQLHEQAKNH